MSRLLTFEHRDPRAAVLIVTNSWPHEAEPRYGIFVKRQVDTLIAGGLACDVLFVRGFESALAYPLAALKLLLWTLRPRPRYRLVNGHGGETLVPCLFFRGRRILSYYGDDLLGTPRPDGSLTRGSRMKRTLLRQLSRFTTRTVTQSREMERALPARIRDRNAVLPSGVDRSLFRPADRNAARRRIGWPDDARIALFAADPKLSRKRYPLATAACADAARRGVPVRLEPVHSVSPDDMPTYMNAADCLLLTSKIEGSPNVVKEALMCDLPVVATAVGDVAEVLDGIANSFVCDATPSALGAALVACLSSGERSDGHTRAEWLDEQRIAQRMLALLDGTTPERA